MHRRRKAPMDCPSLKCSKSGTYIECAKVEHWVRDYDLLIDALMHDDKVMIITIEGPLLKTPCKSLRMEIHMHESPILQGCRGDKTNGNPRPSGRGGGQVADNIIRELYGEKLDLPECNKKQ